MAPYDDDGDTQARRPRHDAARECRRRRVRRARHAHGARCVALARAPARGPRSRGAGRARRRSRASRACSRSTGHVVRRSYLPGVPLYEAPPRSRAYFVDALRVLRRLHRAGIAHNDLAKEANWLVTADDAARSSTSSSRRARATRTARFRRRAYEDLRHLLKHKRTYQPQRLTARQRRVLARADVADAAVARARQAAVPLRDARRARLARARRDPSSGALEVAGHRRRRLECRPLAARPPPWTSVTRTI